MDGEHLYELRSGSRSRSQTPMVQNQASVEAEPVEHNYDLRSISRERSRTPAEVTSSRRSGSRSVPGSSSKIHDHTMETINERIKDTVDHVIPEVRSRRSDSSTSTNIKKVERRSERQRAKRQIFVNGQDENKEDVSYDVSERKNLIIPPKKVLTSDYSSEESEKEDPPHRPGSAYKIYKRAGEWWNVFPKTDYTYSTNSQCRYEIAPGVLAMPNMSRRSIHSDTDNHDSAISSISEQRLSQSPLNIGSNLYNIIDTKDSKENINKNNIPINSSSEFLQHTRRLDTEMKSILQKKTHIQQYRSSREIIYTDSTDASEIRQRAPWTSILASSMDFYKHRDLSYIDTDTELDEETKFKTTRVNQRWKIFHSLTVLLSTYFNNLKQYFTLKRAVQGEYRINYDYSYNESKWRRLWKSLNRALQYIYLLIVKIILLDGWLLSRFTDVRRQVHQRGLKILWIPLLLLLILAGYMCLPYISQFFLTTKSTAKEAQEILLYDTYSNMRESSSSDQKIVTNNDLNVIMEAMDNRLRKLERHNIYQTEHVTSIGLTLDNLKQDSVNFWKKYDDKVIQLDEKLNEKMSINSDVRTVMEELYKLQKLYFDLKSYCDTNSLNENVRAVIEKVVAEYVNTIISKEATSKSSTGAATYTTIQNQVNEPSGITEAQVHQIVKDMLKVYDADKTGQVDYALESAGGQIISTRCTQTYDIKSRAFMLFGVTLYYVDHSPRIVIQGNTIQPGSCWAFKSFPGYLLIKLRGSVHITGFTVEHAPRSLLTVREMSSAPRKFNVWGLTDENDPQPVLLGDYEFIISDDNLQYFPVQNSSTAAPYEYVELRVDSNHGRLEYTCLYRFRVHGVLI